MGNVSELLINVVRRDKSKVLIDLVIAHDIEVEIPAVAPISAIGGISTSVS